MGEGESVWSLDVEHHLDETNEDLKDSLIGGSPRRAGPEQKPVYNLLTKQFFQKYAPLILQMCPSTFNLGGVPCLILLY